MVIIARATRVLKPASIFEIGTFNGQTTAIFMLNSDPTTRIFTLDLPVDSGNVREYISNDARLVANRELGSVPQALGLDRYSQIHCDSMQFDPAEFLDSMDLCLVDGAHDLTHVKNDTIKVARMVRNEGIVFWHDYGGKGSLRPLAHFLDSLGKRGHIFRIPDTSLAWAEGRELKTALQAR